MPNQNLEKEKSPPQNYSREDLVDYYGTPLVKSNAAVLIEIEKLIEKPAEYRIVDSKVVTLSIRGQFNSSLFRIENLPENLGNLTELEQITIKYQNFTQLPPSFAKLTNLTQIHITGSNLKSIDLPFQNFTKLVQLDLHSNKLSEFPKNIEKTPNLKKLHIGSNPIQTIPNNFGNLTSIEKLYISECQISTIPKSFKHLVNLKDLNINRNKIEFVPDFITKLPQLQIISVLEYNPIRSLSNLSKDSIKWLPKAYMESKARQHTKYFDKFRLTKKGISLLESGNINGLLRYYMKSTKQLAKKILNDVNSLTNEEMERLVWEASTPELQLFNSALHNPNYNNNKKIVPSINRIIKSTIESIEKRIQTETEINHELITPTLLPSHAQVVAEIVKSKKNIFEQLRRKFPEKKYNKNNISSILYGFGYKGGYKTNSELQITELSISNIPIPENIGNLTTLQTLNLTNVQESEILIIPLQNFSKLEKLSFESCKLSQFPPRILKLKNLKSLFINIDDGNNDNEGFIIPKWLGNLTKLEYLGINGCNAEYLPESITNLNNLTSLDISYTKIQNLPKLPPSIREFRMRNTPIRSLSNVPKNIFDKVMYDWVKNGEGGWLDDKGRELLNAIEDFSPSSPSLYRLYNYYKKPLAKILEQYIDNSKSLTTDEIRRLSWEAEHREKEILELKLPATDPILVEISKRLSIPLKNGLKIMK